jgi:hypothetical protein
MKEFRNRLKTARPWRPAFDLAFTTSFGSRVTGCDDYFLHADFWPGIVFRVPQYGTQS